MSSYKLTYFNARGRAELTRLIFTAAGVDFVDERIRNWPTGKENSPTGKIPYLTVDGSIKIPHSIAIARFAARRFGLAGTNDVEEAQTDAIVNLNYDFQSAYFSKVFAYRKKVDLYPGIRDKFINDDFKQNLTVLEKLVAMYGTPGYSVGNGLKWSDLSIFDTMDMMLKLNANLVNPYPRIADILKTVHANQRIKDYLSKRAETSF